MLHLTEKNFASEAVHCDSPVIVMFYASWCPKCALMKPVMEDLEKKFYGKIRFCEAEISESPALAAKYGADHLIPAFILFRDNKVAGIFKGIIAEELFEQRIKKIFINC